jgi:sugar (pentulose or hexulose) kinase
MTDVIAVFDIGKTNKKLLLFDNKLNMVYCEEKIFDTIIDDDDFECDDIGKIEKWVVRAIYSIVENREFNLKGVNFATYGASLVYLDEHGKRLTPMYNYLKPLPDDYFREFYDQNEGMEEFSRKTASPALGMLNSGLQILWLKREKTAIFKRVRHILHFPQYLSYLFTKKVLSEFTSIGCHTAMWDFDTMQYHPWLAGEGVMPESPVSNNHVAEVDINGKPVLVGAGIHDSSSSLVPYLQYAKEKFILVSTGTWCINMNPFNTEPLTASQLGNDCLSYMTTDQKHVKSSRVLMGHIHDLILIRLNEYFGMPEGSHKDIPADFDLIDKRIASGKGIFFTDRGKNCFMDNPVDLSVFAGYREAYHQMVADLSELCIESINLIIPSRDEIRNIYVTGGFARNSIFMQYVASRMPGKRILRSEIDNATAMGAALIMLDKILVNGDKNINLELICEVSQ